MSSDRISFHNINRTQFIGGSDARIIMGKDEKALLRLWKEKRGESAPGWCSQNRVACGSDKRRAFVHPN